MSVSKPAASRPSWRYGRSLFSQRGEDDASGRITQARVAPASPPPSPVPEQPASSNAETPASATTEINEGDFKALPFCEVEVTPLGCTRRLWRGTAIIA